MEYIPLIITVATINLIDIMGPGPGFIIVMRNTLSYSRKIGFFTGLGIALGDFIHIAYCLLGIAVIISRSMLLFNTIKYIGVVYLVFLGVKSFFSKTVANIEESDFTGKTHDKNSTGAVKEGFLTTIFNPKSTLMFLGLFTTIITPAIPPHIIAILVLLMFINPIIWFYFISVFFTQKRIRTIFLKYRTVFDKIFGSLLIALGAIIALSPR